MTSAPNMEKKEYYAVHKRWPKGIAMTNKPETFEEWEQKGKQLLDLLLECRDALPAISAVSARLHNVSLTLADRIESAMKPWEIS